MKPSNSHANKSRQAVTQWEIGEEKKDKIIKQQQKRNFSVALFIAIAYLGIYLVGRIIWCNLSQNTLIGWLFTARPSGEHSYLYGWLLSSNLFWYTMMISVIPSFWGKRKFSYITLLAFIIGFLLGIVFGPNPEGSALGQGHYGWAIWSAIYLLSILIGILVERFVKSDIPEILSK